MSSKKNIAKEIKNEILSYDCNYDYVYKLLEENPEKAMSGILNSILQLFKNVDNINNKETLDNLIHLLNNYVKDSRHKKTFDKINDKIQVFLDNISKNFSYIKLHNVEEYIESLIDIQNKCLANPLKKCKNDRYNFIMHLIFKKRDIELLTKYLYDNMKDFLVNKTLLTSVFINIIENYIKIDEENEIEVHYYNQVINVFLRGKLYEKFFKNTDNEYMHILKTSDKKFVWDLIEQIENNMQIEKEELASDYGVSFVFPKDMEIIKYTDYGMYDFTDKETITIDGENDLCLDDALCVERNSDGTYKFYIHVANPTPIIPYESNVMQEALRRTETIFMPEENSDIPIFESYLSDNILSILPNKKTNVMTFMMTVDTDFSIILDTVKMVPGVIVNKHKLSYEKADEILASPDGTKLSDDLMLISQICNKLSRENLNIRAFHKLENIVMKRNNTNSAKSDTSSSHLIVEQSMVFVNRLPYILDRYYNLGLILPWRVQPECTDDYVKQILSNIDKVNTSDPQFINVAKNYMMHSKYSEVNIGHSGLGVKGYCRLGSGARRAMDDLALYALNDLYINRNKVDIEELDAKYLFWEREIKYWCEYANNRIAENNLFVEEYSYRYNKGKILVKK